MNIAGYAIRHKAVTLVMTAIATIGGMLVYGKIGRLEDPQFTIKTAVISTQYPGATAEEVEQEVTERIETAVQQLKQLDKVRSKSFAGYSVIYADMHDKYDKTTLPQVWDELRRKIGKAAADLPPGCGEPQINDDFGDVYGIFFAITGDGYSYHDLRKLADDLRRELLLCDNVGRVDSWGIQTEVVYVEIDRAKLAQMELSPQTIFNTLDQQNAVTPAGNIKVQDDNMNIRITGESANIEDLGEILIRGGEDRMIRLKDVASIKRGYYDPPMNILLRNGHKAVGLGVSVIDGGNVVVMGDAVKAKLAELAPRIPVGMEICPIAFQADTVREAVDGFVMNLVEAVIIVVLLLVVFMGLREGFIIGAILLITIFATFIGMKVLDVNLQRISLGALIIALGMLVDNAIVVAEGIVIKSHHGLTRTQAAAEAVHETQWPLFGATCIAILAFAAISISQDVTGEFLGSLFKVIALSLGLSWVFAVTVTPYL
ncbi:MAG: efflux RND transporter permease subunit, partial [Planctomycetes bacterium]|nr:efflux RND transporter permease subunit [Planctomycetota bacterium]